MAVRVLIVDDSKFFQRRVKEILVEDPRITVVGLAENGLEAIKQASELKPDVITMDIEMPVMDGITAVRRIMATKPVPIIMFSSLTTDGAQSTLEALDAGAVDFLPKKFEEIAQDRNIAKKRLCDKVVAMVRGSATRISRAGSSANSGSNAAKKSNIVTHATNHNRPIHSNPPLPSKRSNNNVKLVAIGTSTGGPVALQQVLTKLPENFPVPILLVQHMPGSFTPAFAKRLDGMCSIHVKEASDGDVLEPGTAYLAPGGMQMFVAKGGIIKINDQDASKIYNPSVDTTFFSANEVFSGEMLAVILTGMGADGCEASKKLKAVGSEIWAQDEQSCVVFGMPGAIIDQGIADFVYPVTDIGDQLVSKFL